MAKVTITIIDDVVEGEPGLNIKVESDPPFPNMGPTSAQAAGLEFFKVISKWASGEIGPKKKGKTN